MDKPGSAFIASFMGPFHNSIPETFVCHGHVEHFGASLKGVFIYRCCLPMVRNYVEKAPKILLGRRSGKNSGRYLSGPFFECVGYDEVMEAAEAGGAEGPD